MAAHQASPSLGFSRREHCSGLLFPSPMRESEVAQSYSFSCVRLCATPWTAAYQAPLSLGFSRRECCSGLPLPAPSPSMAVPKIPKLELPHYLAGCCIKPGCLGPVQVVCVAVGECAGAQEWCWVVGWVALCALCCREYLAVFKKTVSSHEVFLQRLSSHPVLSKDRNFHVFLEYDQDVSYFNSISTI